MILLVITGTMGSGKTSVLQEASDVLAQYRIPHAAVDLDALGGARCVDDADDVMYENLASISHNYAGLGLTRFLVARAIESRADLNRCCRAVGATETLVCRLVANHDTMTRRVTEREQGMLQKELVRRVTLLTEILDKARVEDFTISTENRRVTETAHEMLVRAHWIVER